MLTRRVELRSPVPPEQSTGDVAAGHMRKIVCSTDALKKKTFNKEKEISKRERGKRNVIITRYCP
jgi:hypothetical protein